VLSIFIMCHAGLLASVRTPFDTATSGTHTRAVDGGTSTSSLLSWAWRISFLVVSVAAFAFQNRLNYLIVSRSAADGAPRFLQLFMLGSWSIFPPIVWLLNVCRLTTPLQEAVLYMTCDVMAKLLGIALLMNSTLSAERRLRTQAEEEATRARLIEAESSANERDVERRAHRVINHTSKRVMSNTAQCCELIIKRLRDGATTLLGSDGEEVRRLLNVTRTQSVNGFHMCRSVLLQSSIIRGEHIQMRDEFTMQQLFDDLGLVDRSRIELGSVPTNVIRADKQVLASILFNATQNALAHGETGGLVLVSAALNAGELHVTVCNRPGKNHDKLVAALQACSATRSDLLGVQRGTLEAIGCGADQSTFQGLNEMRIFSSAFSPPADVHVWVQPDSVLFELRVRVTEVAPAPMLHEESYFPSCPLPEGMVFVCCDDDDIPRIFAQLLLSRAGADMDASLILGETYEEMAGMVDNVIELAATHGDQRVLVILDQNLDGYDEGHFMGTGLVHELRQRGFGGLLVIQSANDQLDDEQRYLEAGADGSIGKAVKGGASKILSVLGRLWQARFREGDAPTTST